jgi:hypothetical protein
MNYKFIQENIQIASISVFLTFYILIIVLKPNFLYNKDGSLREFGVGFKKKTVVPVWLLSIILGIMSYYIMLYYSSWPTLFL